ncbi:phosphodiester glycosidase family protein [Nocardioides ginkgobilobae]
MSSRSIRAALAALALSGLVATGLPGATGAGAGTGAGDGSGDPRRDQDRRVATFGDSGHTRHTSDRERGPIAPYVPPGDRIPLRRTTPVATPMGPGVTYTRWGQTDARGPVQAHLLAVDLDTPGVRLDVVNPGRVAAVEDVLTMARRNGVLAAVNGDFYDIGRTGAPLGVSASPRSGLMNARETGWNQGFYLTRKGRPQFGEVTFTGRIRERPGARVTNVNSHFVLPGGIGVYTPRWGRSPGYAVTQGQERDIRMVEIRDGRVVANRGKLRPGREIRGLVLVGRGPGAVELRKLGRGPAHVSWWLRGRPQLVITGSKLLIDDGQVMVVDDAEMHPRTAVGIDRDTNEVLLLAVDGRSEESRGYTMVELARMMQDLGADEALNLDGGGSTTMVGRRSGTLRVLNDPSDSVLRNVANALVVRRG